MTKKNSNFEVDYKCRTEKCGNTQTLLFFGHEKPMAVTNCVKCRAGFGIQMQAMVDNNIGMFPVAVRHEG